MGKVSTVWAVVVVQLVERSLPTPEVCGSNRVIGKFYTSHNLLTVLKRRKWRKRGRVWPFKKWVILCKRVDVLVAKYFIYLTGKNLPASLSKADLRVKIVSKIFVQRYYLSTVEPFNTKYVSQEKLNNSQWDRPSRRIRLQFRGNSVGRVPLDKWFNIPKVVSQWHVAHIF